MTMTTPEKPQAGKPQPKPSSALVEALVKITEPKTFRGVITAADAQVLMTKLGLTLPKLMLELATVASEYSVAPISNYHVGAIACGLSGNLYYGANMEFSGRPLSLCTHAEQAATINAWVNGEQGLTSLAVGAAPCGYCRQFLYETATAGKFTVVLADQTLPLSGLLPIPFGPGDLGVTGALLSPQSHGLTLIKPNDSPAVQGALAAANMSYAPYTQSFAGIGLLMVDGTVCGAPYAENAAYNPSISPLEAALSMLNLWGYSPSAIGEVALVQVQNAKVTQDALTAAVLEVIGSPTFTVAYAQAAPGKDH